MNEQLKRRRSPESYERLADVYRDLLRRLKAMGPGSAEVEDVRAWRRVRKNLSDRLRRCEAAQTQHNLAELARLAGQKMHSLPPVDNGLDNDRPTGVENA